MTSGYFALSRHGRCVIITSANYKCRKKEVACAKAAGICQQVIHRLISRLILMSLPAVILPLRDAVFHQQEPSKTCMAIVIILQTPARMQK